MTVTRIVRVIATVLLLCGVFAAGWISGRLGIVARAVDPATLSDKEREFTERMRNVSLVGHFTVRGRGDAGASDRYDISSAEKVGDGLWRFTMRMRHGNVDVSLPVIVPLQWVGDTPTIVM